MSQKTEKDYQKFLSRVDREIMSHRVIHDNKYTKWFSEGRLSEEDVRRFAVQFSVFSNLFILAQLKKTFNADSLEEMRASKEILMNELGVVFRKTAGGSQCLGTREKSIRVSRSSFSRASSIWE